MKQLLLLEDDMSLGETLKERLEKETYLVVWAQSLGEAYQALDKNKFDLLILDVGLPDGSGFDFAKVVLKSGRHLPFLFMTAMNTAENRLEGYEMGASEFIPKPFHLRELLLRIEHVLKDHAPVNIVQCADRQIDFDRRAVRKADGTSEFLQTRDFELLKLLIEFSPRVLSRDEILNQVWGEDKFPSHRTVDNAIVRLRQVLGDEAGKFIRSARGVGYQWIKSGFTNGS